MTNNDVSSPTDEKFLPSGTLIGERYEVSDRSPMEGGMGIVYQCLDNQEGQRPVALKTLRSEYLSDWAVKERFLREGETWVKLGRHSNIVRAYQVIRNPGGLDVYLVLEFVAKEKERKDASLRSWLTRNQPLEAETALLFALQIVRGMKYATEKIEGFVHRDLKPENVLIVADQLASEKVNRVRVTDFGLIAVLDEGIGMARSEHEKLGQLQLTDKTLGTAGYMAPEQWRREELSVATDVYALGCILYEMLAGRPAVAGRDKELLKTAHCEGEIQPLQDNVPMKVVKVVEKCLAVKPEERYKDWHEVETVLGDAYWEITGQKVPKPMSEELLNQQERVADGYSYNELGLFSRDIGKPERALDYFEKSLMVGQDEGMPRLEAAGLGNLGLAYADIKKMEQAIECHEKALTIHRQESDRQGEEGDLGNLGNVYKDLGNPQRAIEYYEQALTISREISDLSGESKALASMGSAYIKLNELQRAISYYEQTLAISEKIGDYYSMGTILNNMGGAYKELGKIDKAIEYYLQALAIYHQLGSRRGEGVLVNLKYAYEHLENDHLISGHPRQAIVHYQQWLETSRKFDDKSGETAALNKLGSAYLQLGDVRQANEYHGQALKIAREANDRECEGRTLNNLGIISANMGQPKQAIEHFEQALAIALEIGDRQGEGGALGNLGIIHRLLAKPQQAIEYCEKSFVISRDLGDKHGEANALGNLGNVYADLGKMRQAIKYYEQQLVITQEIGDEIGSANGTFNMAGEYAKLGEWTSALELAQKAAQLYSQIGHDSLAQQAQQMVDKIRMKMN